MNLRPRKRQDPDISLTPLIDVVFLLLIFFMVSTTFDQQSEIAIDLPRATSQPVETENVAVHLTIDVQGRYYVNEKRVVNRKLATLRQALQAQIGDSETVSMVISADANTPHQAVITAMDAARAAGIVHVSLATRHSDSGN